MQTEDLKAYNRASSSEVKENKNRGYIRINKRKCAPSWNSDLTLNESCKWQIIKKVSKILPDICISIFSQALIIETIPETRTQKISDFERRNLDRDIILVREIIGPCSHLPRQLSSSDADPACLEDLKGVPEAPTRLEPHKREKLCFAQLSFWPTSLIQEFSLLNFILDRFSFDHYGNISASLVFRYFISKFNFSKIIKKIYT